MDGGISENFVDSETEIKYSELKLGPCLFQDDIARLSEDLDSVRDGNKRVEHMADTKLLDFNLEKSSMIIIGNRNFKKLITKEIKENPIMFCNNKMKIIESEKYLGDYVS